MISLVGLPVVLELPPPVPVVLVAGPTASGKTALAHSLAKLIDGEIVNVDSVQFYQGVPIASCVPSYALRSDLPYHLYEAVPPTTILDARSACQMVADCAREIVARGKVPLLVGSSGLYISSLLSGLNVLPTANAELRAGFLSRTTASLYEELTGCDRVRAAELHPNDRQRIERALEVTLLSGKAHSELVEQHGEPPFVAARIIVLFPERGVLHERIEARCQELVAGGLVEETRKLLVDFDLSSTETALPPILRAIGPAHAMRCLDGTWTEGQMLSKLISDTRAYAKRQCTFWRSEPLKRGWQRSAWLLPSDGEDSSDLPPSEPLNENALGSVSVEALGRALTKSTRGVASLHQVWYLRQASFL